MAYRDNVTALAASLGISNDPGLREEDLLIEKITFFPRGDSDPTVVRASDMNRAGRLFFQANIADLRDGQTVEITESLLALAETYFAEIWDMDQRRTLIYALRTAVFFRIGLKD